MGREILEISDGIVPRPGVLEHHREAEASLPVHAHHHPAVVGIEGGFPRRADRHPTGRHGATGGGEVPATPINEGGRDGEKAGRLGRRQLGDVPP